MQLLFEDILQMLCYTIGKLASAAIRTFGRRLRKLSIPLASVRPFAPFIEEILAIRNGGCI